MNRYYRICMCWGIAVCCFFALAPTPVSAAVNNYGTVTNVTKMGTSDWFQEGQYLFPRESTATVIDIETGKIFQVKRTYGTNHADVEPLTKTDSETIKNIWGDWSWDRRAIVVITDGAVIAASMSAMPHAGLDSEPNLATVSNRSGGYGRGLNFDAVKGNGVDGHMDIHFLNSRTHGSNSVDKAHQQMIAKAAQYIEEHY